MNNMQTEQKSFLETISDHLTATKQAHDVLMERALQSAIPDPVSVPALEPAVEEAPLDDTLMLTHDIHKLLLELGDVRADRKALEEHEASLKAKIVERMGRADAIANSQGVIIATYKPHVRNTFDTNSFKACYPDLYNRFNKQKEVRTFNLLGFKPL